MIKKYKQLFIGIIIGGIIFSVVPTFAKQQTIEAYFNNIKLQVNGKIIDTGEDEPFSYKSRTYVPARYVAEALGATVKWNETTNTVEVTSNDYVKTDVSNNDITNSSSLQKHIYTPNGIKATLYDDKYYIAISNINHYYEDKSKNSKLNYKYVVYENTIRGEEYAKTARLIKYYTKSYDEEEIINNIDIHVKTGISYLLYEDYINKILPLTK